MTPVIISAIPLKLSIFCFLFNVIQVKGTSSWNKLQHEGFLKKKSPLVIQRGYTRSVRHTSALFPAEPENIWHGSGVRTDQKLTCRDEEENKNLTAACSASGPAVRNNTIHYPGPEWMDWEAAGLILTSRARPQRSLSSNGRSGPPLCTGQPNANSACVRLSVHLAS